MNDFASPEGVLCGADSTKFHPADESGTVQPIVAFDEQPCVLRCSGDEDLATQGARRAALARALKARGDLTVDLSELSFADASLMVDLATLAFRLRSKGRQVLLRGAQPQIHRLIEMVGLHRQPGVEFA